MIASVPRIVNICTAFIEEHGVVHGIYRSPGVVSNVAALSADFDAGRLPDFGRTSIAQDVHAVASVLKLYFRQLPQPLFTFHLYDGFMKIAKVFDPERQTQMLQQLVRRLPPPHYRCAWMHSFRSEMPNFSTADHLMRHLHRLSRQQATTGMTTHNFAIVWAPNLFRSVRRGGTVCNTCSCSLGGALALSLSLRRHSIVGRITPLLHCARSRSHLPNRSGLRASRASRVSITLLA